MSNDIVARRLFREQIRKELIDEIRKYQVGLVYNDEMFATKTSDTWNGYLFVIPNEVWKEWSKNA